MAAVPALGRASQVEAAPLRRESAAASDLYDRYSARIYRYCYGRLRSREEAEDATQITFMNAFRGLSRGVTPELEQAWLYKIAENVCLTRVRSNVRRLRVESPTDLEPMHEIVAAPESEDIDLEALQDVLARLPEQQRRAILLREWQGLSYAEIANELGLSQSAVETLIFRARRSLAKGLRESEGGRFRKLANAGTVIGWLKSILLGGSTAAKVAAVVAAGAAVAATSASHANKAAPRADKRAAAPAVEASAHRTFPVLTRPSAPKGAAARKAQPMRLAPVRAKRGVAVAAHVAATSAPVFSAGRRERPEQTQEEQRSAAPPAHHAAAPPASGPPAEEAAPEPKDETPAPAAPPKPEHPVVPAPNEHAAPPAISHPQPPVPPAAGPKGKQQSDEPASVPDEGDDQQ